MKIKRFISGTCGRIKPDVGDVDSGLHISLSGSIDSRKAANEKRQRNVLWNGFMCKIKKVHESSYCVK